jgi:hypothetical protein
MFSKSDGFRDVETCIVSITLSNNSSCSGNVQKPRSKTFTEYLNNGSQFLEIELFTGAVVNISKTAIVSCEVRDVPRADQLALMIRKAHVYHPLGTLGIKEIESREQVREAYKARMRLYHGDKYASLDLPTEVMRYLDDMAKRVNAAYQDAMTMFEGVEKPTNGPAAARAR